MHPYVSVIIPTYNRAEDLRRCLGSLTKQSFKEFEVLVCDDGSTDNTFEVVGEFTDRLQVRYENDINFGGPARPRNRGIRLAKGKYVAFLDSDDWWAPEKLKVSIAYLEKGADIVFHDLWLVRSRDQKTYWRKVKSYQPNQASVYSDLLIKGNALPNSSIVVRGDILRQVGGFSEDKHLIATEDFDAWLRIARTTNKFKRVKGCWGYYWAGGGNLTGRANIAQVARLKYAYESHIANLIGTDRDKASATLAYLCGRVYQLCDDERMATPLLRACLLGSSLFSQRVKSLVLLIGLFLKKRGVAYSK